MGEYYQEAHTPLMPGSWIYQAISKWWLMWSLYVVINTHYVEFTREKLCSVVVDVLESNTVGVIHPVQGSPPPIKSIPDGEFQDT